MGVDCSLVLKQENGMVYEIQLDRWYAFSQLDNTNKFVAKDVLIQTLKSSLNIKGANPDTQYVSYWKGYAIGILENLLDPFNVIELVGIFDENQSIIEAITDTRYKMDLKYSDRVWLNVNNNNH